MSRGPDAGTRLARALEQSRPGVIVVRRESSPWASVTFNGARHRIALTLPDVAEADEWIESLPEADLVIPGHLVADLTVARVTRHGGTVAIAIDVLTVAT